MNEAYIGGLIALAGSALGFLGALVIADRNARAEERKHFRELGLQVAFAKFKKEGEIAQKMADLTGQIRVIPPISVFVVDGIKMMEVASDKGLSADEVGVKLSELNDFTEAVIRTMIEERQADSQKGKG